MANDQWELQTKLEGLQARLQRVGLSLNNKKSRSITIVKGGWKKQLTLTPTEYFTDDGAITAMGVKDQIRYLGLHFSWKGMAKPRHTGELQRMLQELKESPLKPFQRLELLRDFAIPRLIHKLVLGGAHRNTLESLDRMTRAAVRGWLPGDTPLGFLQAPIWWINIPCLSTMIPFLQKAQLEKLLSQNHPVTANLVSKASFTKAIRAANRPVRIGQETITNKAEASAGWTRALHGSVSLSGRMRES